MNWAAFQIVSLMVMAAPQDCEPWITRSGYGSLGIVVAETASPSERYGAEQFKTYWARCTGYDAAIGEVPRNPVTVWIGRDGLPAELQAAVNLEGLEPDGLCIKTVGNNLILAGGRQRGTMYAVFEFFQRYMGVRWLAPDCTHVPPPPESLPSIDYRYVPPFEWRDINYRAFQEPSFAAIHRLNGQFPRLPESMGGHLPFANGFGHTFHSFVSPAEYGQDHPEYFSEVNGERRVEPTSTQLCLTNPDVLRIVVDKTRDILRKSKSEHPIVCITQMDTGFWCECAACAAIDKREGSQSGSMIWFVNQVADAVKDEFPRAYIDTFAYTYTRKPPKHIRPRDNVIVRLCSIECNFARTHDDPQSEHNRAFHDDIRRWSKIAKNLYVWDYTQNWYCHQQPHPNFHVLQPNIRFFAEHGVRGLFEQASPSSPHSDFEYLKAYILARAMWDPNVDWRALMDEFIAIYYEQAAPYIHQYIDLITKKALDDDYYLAFNSRLEWMDYDTVVKAEIIFQKAFAAVENNAVVTDRLRSVYLSVQYAALVCIPRMESVADGWILTRPPSLTFDEYWDLIGKMGVTHLGDEGIDKLPERFDGQTLPRYQRLAIEKLENDRYELWVVPEICGAIVRFRNKQSGADVFRGKEAILNDRWRWQDWEVMDPQKPLIEKGISGPYTVVERTSQSISLEKTLKNGLAIRRTMTLKPGSDALEVEFALINRTDKPQLPLVKPHPEFWLQGCHSPQIWVEKNNRWQKQALSITASTETGAGSIDPAGVTRWAVRIPAKRLAIVSTVCPENVEKLFYYFNVPSEHVNLEMVPVLSPLEPGASRTIKAEYTIGRNLPKTNKKK